MAVVLKPPKPWDPKAAGRRSEAREKEREKIRKAEKLMRKAEGEVEDDQLDGDEIDVDKDRSAGAWSTVRNDEVDAGKERGGSEGNPAAAGVTMTEKKGTPTGDPRQGDTCEDERDDSEIVEPPPLEKRAPFKVLRAEVFEPNPLPPMLVEFLTVDYDAWEKVDEAPVDWAWEGIAANDSHVEISGPTYSGKTTLAFLLAVASASTVGPVNVLGRKVIPISRKRRVLIVEEEDGLEDCWDKLRSACQMLGLDPRTTVSRIAVACRTGFHPGGEVAEMVRTAADMGCFGRIFLDSRARIFFESKANSEEDQAMAARWVTELINRGQCSVWVIGHTRKGSADELEDMSGNHQRAAAADVILLVRSKHAKFGNVLSSRVVFKKLRRMKRAKDQPKPVVFSIECDKKDHWQLTHTELTEDDVEVGSDAPLADKIVAMVSGGEDVSVLNVMKKLRVGRKVATTAIEALIEQKVIVEFTKSAPGRHGRGRFIKLRPSGHFDSYEELVDDGDEADE